MSSSRVKAPTGGGRIRTSVHWSKDHRASRSSKVLAERNPPVVAVGAWVEGGREFPEHPAALALVTEALQAEKRRENEESLQRFQDGVRHRLAQQAQFSRRRREKPERDGAMTPDRRTPQQRFQVWSHMEPAGAASTSLRRPMERSSMESTAGMRQVRLRLAACRMMPHEDTASNLPGGEWNVSAARHTAQGETGADALLYEPHQCPLVQQKASAHTLWETDKSHPDSGFKSSLGVPPVLWPLTGQEELKRQRQSQFLMHRRLVMTSERERVKENKEQWKHLKKTARIKAEKEQIRLEEERKLEEARRREEARQKLEERELLILERMRLEEEERAEELQRRRRQEKGKDATRFVEALRARLKERLSQAKLDLPPLCCCASSFWDSHPDTCANNCVFHNNPKAYAQALHSTMVSLDFH